jgi:hypothetical protein
LVTPRMFTFSLVSGHTRNVEKADNQALSQGPAEVSAMITGL